MAANSLRQVLSPADEIELVYPPGQNDRDRHGRLLRYVRTSEGLDLGELQLASGNAVARYESRDNHPGHPLEQDYIAAQLATLTPEGAVMTLSCATSPNPLIPGETDGTPEPQPSSPVALPNGSWFEKYESCGALRRNTVGDPVGPFARDDAAEAAIYEWFAHGTGNNGDGDNDGLACE